MSRRLNRSRIKVNIGSFVITTGSPSYAICESLLGNACGAETAYPSGAPEFTPGFQWNSCFSIFNFMLCWSLFALLYFFFWLLCCLFFDIRILITPLVSPNFCFFWEALAWPHHCMEMRFWSIHFLNPVTFYALKCLYIYTTSVYACFGYQAAIFQLDFGTIIEINYS